MRQNNKIPQRYWAGCYNGLEEERKDYKYLKEMDKVRELKLIKAIMKNSTVGMPI